MKAQMEFKFDDKEAEIIYRAIELEVHYSHSDRAKVRVEQKNNKVQLLISAGDTSAFRAAVSAHLRWIKLISSLMDRYGH